MVYPVEELRQIHIDRKAAALLDEALYLLHRLLPVSMGPEPETVIREAGVENGRQHLGNGLLDHPVGDGRDPQLAFAAIGFIDLDSPHWGRVILPDSQLGCRPFPVTRPCPRREGLDSHAIDTGGTLVGSNAVPCREDIVSLQDLLEEILAKGWLRVGTLNGVIAGRRTGVQVQLGSSFVLSVQAFTMSRSLRRALGYYAVC